MSYYVKRMVEELETETRNNETKYTEVDSKRSEV